MGKIDTFLQAIKNGKSEAEAIRTSGVSKATAKIQMHKLRKAKTVEEPEEKDEEVETGEEGEE